MCPPGYLSLLRAAWFLSQVAGRTTARFYRVSNAAPLIFFCAFGATCFYDSLHAEEIFIALYFFLTPLLFTHCPLLLYIIDRPYVNVFYSQFFSAFGATFYIIFRFYYSVNSFPCTLTLVRVPKNNHVKGFLGSILTPTWILGSFLTPADALKSLGLPMFRA